MRRLLVVTALLGVAILAGGACRSPTEVTFIVDSDFPCDKLQGVAFVVAADPNVAEQRADLAVYTTKTTTCESASRIGSLVVLPSGSGGAVTIIGGVRRPVERCTSLDGYKDCIVARRSFSFVDHVPLTIPVVLRESCIDVPCGVETTCARGSCVPSHVSCSDDGTCADPEALAPARDGSADAPSDAKLPDASSSDAPADAPSDAPPDVTPPGHLCAPSCGGQTCAPPNVCCQTFNDRTCQPSTAACQQHGGTGYVALCCTTAAECSANEVCCLPMLATGQVATCQTTCSGPKVCKDMSTGATDCKPDGGAVPVCTFQGGGLYTCP